MTIKRTRFILLAILISVSLFFLLEKNFLPGITQKLSPQKSFNILGHVVSLIKNDYVEEPSPEKTMEGAFKGLVDSLDILSSYLNKEMVTLYNGRKEISMMETGIILYKQYGSYPVVVGIKENSPADKKGIKVGQFISNIDNRSTLEMSMLEANLYLQAKKGGPVHLTTLQSDNNNDVSLERIQLFSEFFSFIPDEKTSGILQIHRLYSPCTNRIKEKILPQLKQAKKPLIIDLRNCYEGDIDEARKFINLFLEADKIGYFEKRGGIREFLSCPDKAELERLPLIIWTNQATMGAAETVAAVLKEHKKARIIGLTTPGLAAKQDFFILDDGSGLLLTSAIFQIDTKNKIWQKGITPDKKIKSDDQSLKFYLKETYSLPL